MVLSIALLLLIAGALAAPTCCKSKWGDSSTCAEHPAGEAAHCNTDWSVVCSSNRDCESPAPSHALETVNAAAPSGDVVYFQVYSDSGCTTPMMPSQRPNMTIERCFVGTYTDPLGKLQTNANANFDCGADEITWTQYPGSASCTPPAGALCINATLSTKCSPVETHMGRTYQKLLNYTARPCRAKYSGPRCPG